QDARLRWHVNEEPGTHNFEVDNRQQFYRMLGDHFFPGDADFDWHEIIPDEEVKSSEELHVPLPELNATVHSLALQLSEDLPNEAALPSDLKQAKAWQASRRRELKALLRLHQHDVQAVQSVPLEFSEGTATAVRLKLGEDWTVPVTEF